jgi:hypothetical protein
MSQGLLSFTPSHCSVLDEPMPSCCILPVRFVLIPGHTAHCELSPSYHADAVFWLRSADNKAKTMSLFDFIPEAV